MVVIYLDQNKYGLIIVFIVAVVAILGMIMMVHSNTNSNQLENKDIYGQAAAVSLQSCVNGCAEGSKGDACRVKCLRKYG